MVSQDVAKTHAAEAAAKLIQDGMIVGLGTGSTSTLFIKKLGQRCREGLRITAVASSIRSYDLAKSLSIPLADINLLEKIDVTVDGADEVDHQLRLIKGGGGALLREKIVACMSREMIVIVDESKVVDNIGSFPLPIEIIPFASKATLFHIEKLGLQGTIRKLETGGPYITDNGNYIYDVSPNSLKGDLELLNQSLINIPGVIETGFFFGIASKVIVGLASGAKVMS